MPLRVCFCLCAMAAITSAESAQDSFSKAFQRAMPFPFEAPQPQKSDRLFPYPFSSDEPHILPMEPNLMPGPGRCAVPLTEMPITKDRHFLIRILPNEKSSKADSMASPAMPVCRQ